jgi:hypothetical protein
MDNADQKKVKDRLRDLFDKPMQVLEDKFPFDFQKIEILKSSLYDISESIIFTLIYSPGKRVFHQRNVQAIPDRQNRSEEAELHRKSRPSELRRSKDSH